MNCGACAMPTTITFCPALMTAVDADSSTAVWKGRIALIQPIPTASRQSDACRGRTAWRRIRLLSCHAYGGIASDAKDTAPKLFYAFGSTPGNGHRTA